jgi:predicted O-methyltransferase YrrM
MRLQGYQNCPFSETQQFTTVAQGCFDDTHMQALNRKVHEDLRVSISTIPLSDGLTIALRR